MLLVLRIICSYFSPEGPVVVEVEYVAELMDYDVIDYFLRGHGKAVIESELSERIAGSPGGGGIHDRHAL